MRSKTLAMLLIFSFSISAGKVTETLFGFGVPISVVTAISHAAQSQDWHYRIRYRMNLFETMILNAFTSSAAVYSVLWLSFVGRNIPYLITGR